MPLHLEYHHSLGDFAQLRLAYDRFGRTLGIVFIDHINLNEALLEKGLAWHYTSYDNNMKLALFEESARLGKLNL